jgi:transcriptional regulator with XRE-family HTH domain
MVNRKEIKRRRLALGMTFRGAAVAAGWSEDDRSRWQKLEEGVPKDPAWSTMESVAKALGCKLDDLLAPPPRRAGKRKR